MQPRRCAAYVVRLIVPISSISSRHCRLRHHLQSSSATSRLCPFGTYSVTIWGLLTIVSLARCSSVKLVTLDRVRSPLYLKYKRRKSSRKITSFCVWVHHLCGSLLTCAKVNFYRCTLQCLLS